jgi:hypothetical protein
MDNVAEMIQEAHRLVDAGKERKAAELLTMAAGETRDPAQSALIHSLAIQRREQAGRFGKSRWDEAIRLSENRLATAKQA